MGSGEAEEAAQAIELGGKLKLEGSVAGRVGDAA
jgi:hypothetical protein